jgi:hypothetical protein
MRGFQVVFRSNFGYINVIELETFKKTSLKGGIRHGKSEAL